MKSLHILLFLAFIRLSANTYAQYRPSEAEINSLPEWAQKMYSAQPNYFEVETLYMDYYREHTFVKNFHTQYYKRWKRRVINNVDENGWIHFPTEAEFAERQKAYLQKQPAEKSSDWSAVGPINLQAIQGGQASSQSNIYCIDQSLTNPDILFSGTEPGEVFKSTNGGLTWSCASLGNYFGSGSSQIWGVGVTAVAISTDNPDVVYIGADGGVFKTTDGGQSWSNTLPQSDFGVNEILVHPDDANLVFACTDKGLYRSNNAGTDWTQLYTHKSYDIKCNTGNSTEMYLVKNNPSLIICQFLKSTDMGDTWAVQSDGWYTSSNPARFDGGARLAVTLADPGRVYAYLIGDSKPNDLGYIGLYSSSDGGETWTLPNGPIGGPFTTTHPNLATGSPDWDYNQGFYNCALMASETNADHVLIGGLNLWRSNNGGATFSSVAGYVGGPLSLHVDMQDFRAVNGTYWVTTDGGIYRSTNFFTSQPEFRMNGLRASDYWGFGSGWNEDVLVGGLYHNGNLAWHENYGEGNFLELGGGEDATGYVNPGNNRKTYYSDIGGVVLPANITGPVSYFSMGNFPNQTYFAAESSEMEFHPNCYNVAYIGKENKIWRTTDGGASYSLLYTFGSNVNNQVKYIEISSSNPDVIYLNQQPASGSVGTLWKTTNGGASWTSVSIPAGNSRRMLQTLNPADENELWIAYPGGNNTAKIYKTTNGGLNWSNLTTPVLSNESVQAIVHIAGTDGGIYYGTEKSVYYRNNSMGDWVIDNAGLPTFFNTNIARPLYRDNKIRIASYGKGIWESAMHEDPAAPIARITVDRLSQNVLCNLEPFYFEDFSFLNHENATWNWTFESGEPATSMLRNPVVTFSESGSFKAYLTVTDGNGMQSSDSLWVSVAYLEPSPIVSEGFQGDFPPLGWSIFDQNGSGQWSVANVGGYGQSSQSSVFRNFDIDSQGSYDDLRFQFSTLNATLSQLAFDVAYAPYGGQYSDTLAVELSTDCGNSFVELFRQGGATIATAPANNQPFSPNATQWNTININLDEYLGESDLLIAFRNIGHWGNNMYIDNVNLQTNLISAVQNTPAQDAGVYPNPLSAGAVLNIHLPEGYSKGDVALRLIHLSGKTVWSKRGTGLNQVEIPSVLSTGNYILNISTPGKIWNKVVVVVK